MQITSTFAIRQNRATNGKPNEDFVIADDAHGIYIVCDGVSRSLINGQYPVPSPAAQASELFAHVLYVALLDLIPHTAPHEALRRAHALANGAVRDLNQGLFTEIDYLENDFAALVSIAALVVGDRFYYAYIGDCLGGIFADGQFQRFTQSQTLKAQEYIKSVGKKPGLTLEVRRDMRNNKAHPLVYGVFTGEESALELVEYGSFPLQGGQTILLASDGLEPYFDPGAGTLAEPDTMIDITEGLEVEHNIRTDDKTVVLISAAEG